MEVISSYSINILYLYLSRCYKFRPLSRIHHSYVLLISAVGILSLRLFIIQGQPPVFVESDNPASFSSSFLTRVLTYSYLCWYNFSLLLYPSYLCFDWSMGSVPLVESLDDWRNIYTVLFFLSFTAIVIHGMYLNTCTCIHTICMYYVCMYVNVHI